MENKANFLPYRYPRCSGELILYRQDGDKNQNTGQNSDVAKIKKDFELLLAANKAYEKRCEENDV